MPDTFRYTDEHPYIGKGLGRNVKEGKAYTEDSADVAEFEDLFLNTCYNDGWQKYGLGIDEYINACIQVSRKNYVDLMPDGTTKKVGNSIKSRKMSGYLKKFIDEAIIMLLHNNGHDFLNFYYDYIEKIYNYEIPIKDIASKGSIKKSLKEYKEDCQKLTKAGNKKSRQAWYELAIQNNLKVNMGDSVYYVNTGTKKNHSDVKKVTHQFVYDDDKNLVELTAKLKTALFKNNLDKYKVSAIKELTAAQKKEIIKANVVKEEDEVILNCKLVPPEIVNSEEDILCSQVDGLEYNSEKYIEQFNNRVKVFLVCFHPDIRNDILIKNPSERKFFTKEEATLVSGYPNKPEDQDTLEALMTPERKEIEFWLKVGERPPFLEECEIEWDRLVEEYKEIKKKEDNDLFKNEDEKYLKAISDITKEEVDSFYEEGTIPDRILDIVTVSSDMHFYFKAIPDMTPSTGGNVFDDIAVSQSVDIDETFE